MCTRLIKSHEGVGGLSYGSFASALIQLAVATELFVKYFQEVSLLNIGSKNWFRAYFNYGLIEYIHGRPRLLPCGAGTDLFFVDPYGELRPCNGMDTDSLENSFGNLSEHSFNDLWDGEKALALRDRVQHCQKNCWMIGTASPAIRRSLAKPVLWVLRNKIRSIMSHRISKQ